ncbi:MAG: FxsA family protein [Pirellulaceae bacterium]
MLLRLIVLLITIPIVETMLLLMLADQLGLLATLAMIVTTGLLGAWLLKRQGLRALGRIRAELAAGRLPAAEVVDGVMIVVAGVMLMTPGILTDSLGIVLLIPASRKWTRRLLLRWGQTHWRLQAWRAGTGGEQPGDRSNESQVVDSYVVRSSETRPPH